ncbi:putative zinc finger protein [Orchesella cincta]|uniref:Putative zinc finger protein n=1 Tax=Orchesella cincta TaxID=48709 RepID=A0A1D2M6F2_ORCCI|nr:putative zinc finger protein [Orchesella cincta]
MLEMLWFLFKRGRPPKPTTKRGCKQVVLSSQGPQVQHQDATIPQQKFKCAKCPRRLTCSPVAIPHGKGSPSHVFTGLWVAPHVETYSTQNASILNIGNSFTLDFKGSHCQLPAAPGPEGPVRIRTTDSKLLTTLLCFPSAYQIMLI